MKSNYNELEIIKGALSSLLESKGHTLQDLERDMTKAALAAAIPAVAAAGGTALAMKKMENNKKHDFSFGKGTAKVLTGMPALAAIVAMVLGGTAGYAYHKLRNVSRDTVDKEEKERNEIEEVSNAIKILKLEKGLK
jgi:hypothetical protein